MNMVEIATVLMVPDDKEKFHFLYGLVVEYNKGLLDFLFKQFVLLAAVGGWLISSSEARKLLAKNLLMRWGLTAFLLAWAVMHAIGVYGYHTHSNKAYERLVALKYMADCAEGHALPWHISFLVAIFHASFLCFIGVALWCKPSIPTLSPVGSAR